MRIISNVFILLLFFATAGHAQDKILSGEEINNVLLGATVAGKKDGKMWRQQFYADGRTTYSEPGAPSSLGRWRIEDDKYCSQWPPAKTWSCWQITQNGQNVTFISSDGETYPSKLQN